MDACHAVGDHDDWLEVALCEIIFKMNNCVFCPFLLCSSLEKKEEEVEEEEEEEEENML